MFILIQENSMHKKFISHLWSIALGLGLLLPFPSDMAFAQSNPTGTASELTTQAVKARENPANTPTDAVQPEAPAQSKAEELSSLTPQQELERGTILLRLGNPRGAAVSFRKTLQAQPQNLAAHQQFGHASSRQLVDLYDRKLLENYRKYSELKRGHLMKFHAPSHCRQCSASMQVAYKGGDGAAEPDIGAAGSGTSDDDATVVDADFEEVDDELKDKSA